MMGVGLWPNIRNVCLFLAFRGSRIAYLLTDGLFPDFSRNDYNGAPMRELLDIIEYVKPTALLGLSTISVCRLHSTYLPACLIEPVTRVLSIKALLRRCQGSTHDLSFSRSRTPSGCQNANSMKPSNGQTAVSSLPLVHHSRN